LRSASISSFLKIFISVFSIEAIIFGIAALAGHAALWPERFQDYRLPDSLPLTVMMFSVLIYLVFRR